MSKFNNISEYVLKASGFTSGSDFDEPNLGVVENESSNKTKVKLYECGPRLNLKIFKIEEGFLKGNVVYHRISSFLFDIVKKSKKEIREIMQEVREKKKLKRDRAKEQMINVKKKEENKLLEKAKKEQEAETAKEGEEGEDDEDEEKKQKIIEQKLKALKKEKKKEMMLNRKREKEKKKKGQEMLIPKKEMRMLKNLQKGK